MWCAHSLCQCARDNVSLSVKVLECVSVSIEGVQELPRARESVRGVIGGAPECKSEGVCARVQMLV